MAELEMKCLKDKGVKSRTRGSGKKLYHLNSISGQEQQGLSDHG